MEDVDRRLLELEKLETDDVAKVKKRVKALASQQDTS